MIGLDSSAIIDFYKGDKELKKVLDGLKEPIALNMISYLEIVFGIDFSQTSYEKEISFYDEMFDSFLFFKLNLEACKKSSEVLWNLKKIGKVIEMFDCAIVGIYLSNGVNKIITRNKKHFENIKEIEIIEY